jgi:hypothetical protein
MYGPAHPIPSAGELVLSFRRRATSFLARTKNAFLLGQKSESKTPGRSSGVSGWTRVKDHAENLLYEQRQDAHHRLFRKVPTRRLIIDRPGRDAKGMTLFMASGCHKRT